VKEPNSGRAWSRRGQTESNDTEEGNHETHHFLAALASLIAPSARRLAQTGRAGLARRLRHQTQQFVMPALAAGIDVLRANSVSMNAEFAPFLFA
jgi:hypothetical protein